MALSAADVAETERRYLEWERESAQLKQKFQRAEEEAAARHEHVKHGIKATYELERNYVLGQLPDGIRLPPSLEDYFVKKRESELAKADEDYEKSKAELKEQFENERLHHLVRYKLVLEPGAPFDPSPHHAAPVQVAAPVPRQPELPVVPAPANVFQPPPARREEIPAPEQRGSLPLVGNSNPSAPVFSPLSPAPRRTPLPDRSSSAHRVLSGPHQVHPQYPGRPQPSVLPDTITVSGLVRKPTVPGVQHETPSGPNLPAPTERREPLSEAAGRAINQLSPEGNPPKRKSDAQNGLNPKRMRVEEQAREGYPWSAGHSPPRSLEKPPAMRKTISFEEVYQNGDAQYKHIIVEYPTNSGDFYILRCEEHGVHFNTNPLAGAAKHLHSAQHGNMTKERAQAVELLGYYIPNCTTALAEKNNKAVREAFDKGYKPFNLNQLSKSSRISLGYAVDLPQGAYMTKLPRADGRSSTAHTPSTSAGSPRRSSPGITNPLACHLYLCYWNQDRRNYVVLVLPHGSLEPAGWTGTLANSGLLDKVPRCYDFDQATQQIRGWAPGYEDGGQWMSKREFPVLYFDGNQSFGWAPAKDLSEFNFEAPSLTEIPHVVEALTHYAKIRGFEDWIQMRTMGAGRDLKTLHRSQLDQPIPPVDPRNTAPAMGSAVAPSMSGAEDHEMRDAPAVNVDDSDRDTASRVSMDSEMETGAANTESRRTSVSNRGETQGDKARQPGNESSGANSGQDPGLSLANQAQLIAARALHLGDLTQEVSTPQRSPQEAEFSAQSGSASRPGSTPSADSGHGHRRVEKIYAHNNPSRMSKSPQLSAGPPPAAPVIPRVSSPASLQNILQAQPASSDLRPGSLFQQGAAAEMLRSGGTSPSPLEQSLPSPGLPTGQRAPRTLMPAAPRLPSPRHILPSNGPIPGQQQAGRSASQPVSLGSNPPSRTPTPVILTSNETIISDRWRAIRNTSQPLGSPRLGAESPAQQTASPPPPVKAEYQAAKSPGVFDVAVLPMSDAGLPDDSKASKVFRLAIDEDTQTATSTDGPEKITIDPKAIKRVVVESCRIETARVVKVIMEDGVQRAFLFDTADNGQGALNGGPHALRFCRWITSVNPSVDYLKNRPAATGI
ncbi:hypothetical protein QBC47DRAFT_403627 [Echria macrotheca]|uniref:Uncharacterized protein n=1 Tax=Echria macrotheca TaxID=438768 RepID=A0AAJ0F578_9PEZI|nr:hypothetical protein QBC47DRAFT_403627 [Echria macrotheca]